MLKTLLPGLAVTGVSERSLAVLVSALLGLVFIFGVGFAQTQAVHDAAHDMRHALTFPCH